MKYLLLAPLAFFLLFMYSFPAAVEAELKRLNWFFALRVRAWLTLCKALLGLDVVIVDGLRTPAEQNALHKQNPLNPAYDANNPSSHILGKAVDVNFWKNGKVYLLKASSAASWLPVVRLAAACGIKWGNFSNYKDYNHFYV